MLPTLEPLPAPPRLRGLLDLSPDEWKAWLQEHDQPTLRARQIRRWLLSAGVDSLDAMTDLPKGLRQALAQSFVPLETELGRHLHAGDDTHKLLLRLRDNNLIECVLIQEEGRRTACISTHVGR